MLLEALEDDLRSPMTEDAHCPRGALTIEHVMPHSWQQHWTIGPVNAGATALAAESDALIHTLGKRQPPHRELNPYVSNNPWLSTTTNGKPVQGKRDALHEHSVLRLNHRLITHHSTSGQKPTFTHAPNT